MECYFCHKPAEQMTDLSYFTLEKWLCHNHKVNVLFTRYKGVTHPYDCVFYVMLGEVKWKINYHFRGTRGDCDKGIACDVSYLRIEGDKGDLAGPHWSRCTVATFDCDPGITPDNAHLKLPTIMVWS